MKADAEGAAWPNDRNTPNQSEGEMLAVSSNRQGMALVAGRPENDSAEPRPFARSRF
jgi:hypothetical protein